MADPSLQRMLTVAMVGAPNAGKSTLVNALVGANVSVVTPKQQTTRERILGVITEGAVQVCEGGLLHRRCLFPLPPFASCRDVRPCVCARVKRFVCPPPLITLLFSL